MLIQETLTRSKGLMIPKDAPALKEKLRNALSRTHRIPNGHIASLDVARLVASLFIVIGHVGGTFVSADYQGNILSTPLVYGFFHLRRMGLPIFLMASGFLFGRSLEKGKPPIPRYAKAFKRLMRIFLIWSIFYAIEPIANPHLRQDFLTYDMLQHYYWHLKNLASHPLLLMIGGTKYNLWFIPSLIASITVITTAVVLKKTRYLLLAAMSMYILAQCLHQEPVKTLVDMSKYFIHFRSYCAGFAFVVFGWWFSQQARFSLKDALKLFGVALFFQIIQDMTLWHFYHLKPDDFMSIGLLPAIFGIFIVLMCYPNFGKNTIFQKAGQMTLGIYVLHPFVFSVLKLLNQKFISLNPAIRDLTFPVIIAIICVYLTKILLKNNL